MTRDRFEPSVPVPKHTVIMARGDGATVVRSPKPRGVRSEAHVERVGSVTLGHDDAPRLCGVDATEHPADSHCPDRVRTEARIAVPPDASTDESTAPVQIGDFVPRQSQREESLDVQHPAVRIERDAEG